MAKATKPKKKQKEPTIPDRSQRMVLTPEESLKRMKSFDERKEAFIASVRKSKD